MKRRSWRQDRGQVSGAWLRHEGRETPEGTARRLPGKSLALSLCLQPLGHHEFLAKLAQVPVSSAVDYVKIIHKEYQEYQQEEGLTGQDAQDEQYEQYSDADIKDNSLFMVPLDFERLPFVELGLINAGEIGRSKVPNLCIHIWPPLSKSTYHRFHKRVNSVRRPEGRRIRS